MSDALFWALLLYVGFACGIAYLTIAERAYGGDIAAQVAAAVFWPLLGLKVAWLGWCAVLRAFPKVWRALT